MSFTKVAPAGIGTEPGNSILIGDSLLHSTGIDIGSNTGIGVTIRKHGDATFTGIITASAFFGDGSGLEGVSSSGIGTALSDDDTSSLNKIYYANQELSIGSTVTVNHPDTGIAAYTHYQDLVVKDNADFIVADGDTFIPDVLGINTSSLPNPVSSATGGRIRAGTLTNAGANGAPNFPNGVTGTSATFTTGTFSGAITAASGTITGNLGVGGVLTYEDVTNIDSVGVITARDGLRVTGITTITSGSIQVNAGGNTTQAIFSGSGGSGTRGLSIVTESVGAQDEGVILNARASGTTGRIKFQTNGTTALTIDGSGSNGNVTLNTGNLVFGTSGKGIDFSATADGFGTSSEYEILDDYEEGNFTPYLGGVTNYSSYNVTGTGHYVKIGKVVHINVNFGNVDLNNSAAGRVMIYNLPFAPFIRNPDCRGVSSNYMSHKVNHASNGMLHSWYIESTYGSLQGQITYDDAGWGVWDASSFTTTGVYLDFSGTYFTAA